MRRTLIPPELSRLIAACQLTRGGTLRVLAGLHGELIEQYARFRHLRHPEDERLFFYFVSVADGGLIHTITFHVDDATSPEHLIVVDLEHEARPTGR